MAGLFLPLQWGRQPQGPTQLNPALPFANDVVALFNAASPFDNSFSLETATTDAGRAVTPTSTTQTVARLRRVASGSRATLLAVTTTLGGSGNFGVGLGDSIRLRKQSSTTAQVFVSTAAGGDAYSGTFTVPAAAFALLVDIDFGGSGYTVYVNGRSMTSAGFSGVIKTPLVDLQIGGNDFANGGGCNLNMGAAVARRLSAGERAYFFENPWRLFSPIERGIWIAIASGSGSTGTVAVTEENDTSSASGTTTVVGSSSVTEANDTSSASGTTTIVGTSAVTEQDDTSAASGTTTVTGTAAPTEENDTSAASGTTTVTGTAAPTEENDTSAASGTSGSPTGTVDVTEEDDTSSASGETPRARRGAAKPLRKGYIIRGKKYWLTDDELAILIAQELESIKRKDIKVPTKGRIKPIPTATYEMVRAVAKKIDELAKIGELEDEDEDDEDLLAMLL